MIGFSFRLLKASTIKSASKVLPIYFPIHVVKKFLSKLSSRMLSSSLVLTSFNAKRASYVIGFDMSNVNTRLNNQSTRG